jgi:hypothetical protein
MSVDNSAATYHTAALGAVIDCDLELMLAGTLLVEALSGTQQT